VLGGLPLDEAAIASIEDGLTLLPLASNVRRAGITAATPGFEAVLRGLSAHFDLVVVDYGPLGANPANGLQRLVSDAAMLVRDIRCTSSEQALAAVQRLRELGAQSVGIVQNFT
jgi:Mrp family chromosome partitioning ATPase